MLKGAIFDADGTLLDSMPIWLELGQRYLASYGIAAKPELSDILAPMTLEESSRYLKEAYRLPDSAEQITAALTGQLHAFYRDEVALKPGVADYLRYLHTLQIPMLVASSGDRVLLRVAFARLQIDRYFQDILTCSELQTNKLEPLIYRRAVQMLGTAPQKTTVFEDALYAIQTARRAGLLTVAVADASNHAEAVRLRQTADYFIRDFTDPVLRQPLFRRDQTKEGCI